MSSPTAEAANLVPPGLAGEDVRRRRILLARWRRRSALVRSLRKILPALAAVMVAALAISAGVNTLYRRLAAGSHGDGLAIRMLSPSFQGRDKAGKPFRISADSATRDDNDANRISMDKPVFILGAGLPDETRVHAVHGVYREDTRILDLTGDVHLDDAQGYHFTTEHAVIDTQKSNVNGERPVQGQGPLGRIASSSYAVQDGGAHVFFRGRVVSRIEGRGVAVAGQGPKAAKAK